MTPTQAAWLAAKLEDFTLAGDILQSQIERGLFAPTAPIAPDRRTPDQKDWDEERQGTYR